MLKHHDKRQAMAGAYSCHVGPDHDHALASHLYFGMRKEALKRSRVQHWH